jgi:hypothetical protein
MASPAEDDRTNEAALRRDIQAAYIAVAQGSLDRANTRVNVLTTAIAAVTTLYTGLLALVYAAEPGKGQHLAATGIIPAIFLGCALLLVTVYAAMFKSTITQNSLIATSIGGNVASQRLIDFITWCTATVTARIWALHAGIVSFGVAIATLPLPFSKIDSGSQWLIATVGIAVVTITAVVVAGSHVSHVNA